MSDYCRQKVLRYPVDTDPWEIEKNNIKLFKSLRDLPTFQIAPTVSTFIDYVLEDEYGYGCGDWGKNRELYDTEKEKYKPVFEQIIPDVDMDKVRLVEYCWYNCSEAPDYYDNTNDKFYDEV